MMFVGHLTDSRQVSPEAVTHVVLTPTMTGTGGVIEGVGCGQCSIFGMHAVSITVTVCRDRPEVQPF